MTVPVFETVPALRAFVKAQRKKGARIALVPTMGALHDGHMALVRTGLDRTDCVLASIFVNPTQFGPQEDFAAYPRPWDADRAKLAAAGAHGVFHPAPDVLYPDGFDTHIRVDGVSAPLEGAHRPGHFEGVAMVVAKLLLAALPDIALFGEKDWQQLQVVRRLTADLDIPVEIVGVPIVRDANGLALSSRNAYLDAAHYDIACRLNGILFAAAEKTRAGQAPETVEKESAAALLDAGFDAVDYIAVRDAATLGPPSDDARRVLAAVRCGPARLIDNVPV